MSVITPELTVADVLERAADLIEPEGKWTQGDFARRSDGTQWSEARAATDISFQDFDATCFCLYGAIAKVSGRDPEDCFSPVFKAARAVFPEAILPTSVARWNDAPERTQAEVVAKLREAAAKARERVA